MKLIDEWKIEKVEIRTKRLQAYVRSREGNRGEQ